ncbi:MAG: hypothetical protein H6553_12200 [Chitinophagales bacterium]|nr:hypothetical protein [Chitinophagales bacterium]
METEYFEHEKLNTADDGGDLKESPEIFIQEVKNAGLSVLNLDKLGDWENLKGGFYTATIKQI